MLALTFFIKVINTIAFESVTKESSLEWKIFTPRIIKSLSF